MRFTGWAEWLFFLVLPIVFTLILAGGTGGSTDSRVRLVVVDQASTPLSADFIGALEKSESVRPDVILLNSAESQFNQRQVSALLIIPAEFDLAHLEQGVLQVELHQQPNNMNALIAQRAVQSVITRISSTVDIARISLAEAEKIEPFASQVERQAYFDTSLQQAQSLTSQSPSRLEVVTGTFQPTDTIDYDPRANSSAGQLITWVFIPLLSISALFAYERQSGTLKRILVTPTSRATYLFGTIAGEVATALLQMLLLVGFGILVMKLNWGHAPLALAVILVASALAAAALGTTLGTLVKTEGQASGLSIMLSMVMALLGGCWYPIELFPQFVRNVVKIFPTTWAMQGMLDIVLRGRSISAVLPSAGVLLIFAFVFFVVGIWRFKYE
jgi:ABC-2 type transport system permease protein